MVKGERPTAIVAFEALSLASVLLFMLLTDTKAPFLDFFDDAITVGLTLWVSRGQSSIARIIYTVVIMLAYIAIFGALWLQTFSPVPSLTLMASAGLELVLLALLWWPSASAWLKQPSGKAAEHT